MRILALDLGEKNIGMAISDGLGWTAQALPNLSAEDKDKAICAIVEITKKSQVAEIVLGMPLKLDGTPGEKAKEVIRFMEDLKKKISLPIKAWDERFTSTQAQKLMLEADLSRKKRKKKVDRIAAQLILQSYLDAKNVQKDCFE